MILELQSAKKIIEFLYAEINSSAQHTYAYKVKMPHLYPVLFIMIVRRILLTFGKKLVTLEENTTNIQKYNNNNNL